MTTQPEALRLAQALEFFFRNLVEHAHHFGHTANAAHDVAGTFGFTGGHTTHQIHDTPLGHHLD